MTTDQKFAAIRPKKEETLIVKQQEKQKKLKLGPHLPRFLPQWSLKAGEVFGVVGLLALNFILLLPFFGHPDKTNLFSAPVIPFLVNLTENWLPYAYGVRLWLLIFLLLFPLTFYYFVREISGRKLAALTATLMTSLPLGFFLLARVNLGLLSEDGGQIASLSILPLACLLLLRFLRSGNFWMGFLAALGSALVALMSPLGVVVLASFMVVLTFSEVLLGNGRLKLLRLLVVLFLGAGFSSFWYNPHFALMIWNSPQGVLIRKTFNNLLPLSFFVFPILGVFGYLLFENRPLLQPAFIGLFLTILLAFFSLGGGIASASPSRFFPALGVAVAFFFGILESWFFDYFRAKNHSHWLALAPAGLTVIILGLLALSFGPQFGELESQSVLGASDTLKVGIWEIRDEVSGAGRTLGYGISATTFLLSLWLGKAFSK